MRGNRKRSGMSRRRFLGSAAAGVGAAAMGMSGMAYAKPEYGEVLTPSMADQAGLSHADYLSEVFGAAENGSVFILRGTWELGSQNVFVWWNPNDLMELEIVGDGAVLKANDPNFNPSHIYFRYGKFTLRNLTFELGDIGSVFMVRLRDADGSVVENCTFYRGSDVPAAGITANGTNQVFRKNSIRCQGSIYISGENALIEGNKVEATYSDGGNPKLAMGLRNLTNSLIKNNIITGTQTVGMVLYGTSYGNVFMGNNVQNITTVGDPPLPPHDVPPGVNAAFGLPEESGVFSDVYENVWIGNGGVVSDYGVDNIITGSNVRDLDPKTGQTLGQIIQELMQMVDNP